MCRWLSGFSHNGSVTGHSANLPEHTQVCSRVGTVGQRGEGRREDWEDYCDSRHLSPMFLVGGVLPCVPLENGAWGTPRADYKGD